MVKNDEDAYWLKNCIFLLLTVIISESGPSPSSGPYSLDICKRKIVLKNSPNMWMDYVMYVFIPIMYCSAWGQS